MSFILREAEELREWSAAKRAQNSGYLPTMDGRI